MSLDNQVTIVVKNIEGISKQFLRDNKIKAHRIGAKIVHFKVKSKAPIRSSTKIKKRYSRKKVVATYSRGNLKRSIRIFEKSRGLILIGAEVGGRGNFVGEKADGFYIHMVERGTKHSKAKPFVKPAFESTKTKATQAIAKEYENILQSYLKGVR